MKLTYNICAAFDYGKLILVRPSCSPNVNNHCRFSGSVVWTNWDIFLAGPFDFEPKLHNKPACQIVSYKHVDTFPPSCHAVGIVPAKLANDPDVATHTTAIDTSTNSAEWYNSSIQLTYRVLSSSHNQLIFILFPSYLLRREACISTQIIFSSVIFEAYRMKYSWDTSSRNRIKSCVWT